MNIESLAHVVVILLVLGLIICAIMRIPGLPDPIGKAAQVICIIIAALYILRHFA